MHSSKRFSTASHDIGKMAIPDKILRKPGPLDDSEKQILRTHCEIGYNMLTRIPFLRDAADIVLAHHEFLASCAANGFLSGHGSSPSPILSMPC
jgi:HD-GYP domain-containing protein (c-di-GMP phosphodiesterase class II)